MPKINKSSIHASKGTENTKKCDQTFGGERSHFDHCIAQQLKNHCYYKLRELVACINAVIIHMVDATFEYVYNG